MTKTIAQRELRNDNARVIEEVMGGTDFIVTRSGRPVAELRPLRRVKTRRLVPRQEIVALAVTVGGHIDGQRFRAHLDAHVDQDFAL